MTHPFLHLKTVQEAIAAFRARFPAGSARVSDVPLDAALGRVLATDLFARDDLPAWPRATVDGYAVVAGSVRGAAATRPAYLTLVAEVEMGQQATVPIRPSEAARVHTGAMLPPGADAVVMIEHTDQLDGATIEVSQAVAPHEGVNRIGEDFGAGQLLIPAGTWIRPQEVAVLVEVHRLDVGRLGTELGMLVVRRVRIHVVDVEEQRLPARR
ncbi:MAG: molybdopterin molybdenumtransferase MoeA, partial [Candidatus Riflebacteria bacterium]|nr:molybdopterin molybdenumtransferase MoeA [Candidatus Riflebacteria bacterium]